MRLPGQQSDEETGLHYYRHRYYDPHQERYITPDPIRLAGGLNPYRYPLNPVSEIEPLRLSCEPLSYASPSGGIRRASQTLNEKQQEP
ncbi:RHS repeat-associated core domain-containing protein [Yokenella regensburgei]